MKKYVRIFGSAILIGYLAWSQDWRQVGAAFARLNVALWLLAVLVYLSIQVVSSIRWRMLGRVQGYDAPIGAYIAYYYIGMFFSNFLPTSVGGDVVRVWYLANRDGTGPREGRRMAALVSVMAERVNGIIVLVMVACFAVIFSPMPLPSRVSLTVAIIGAAAVAGILAVPFLGWLFEKFPLMGNHPRLAIVRRLLAGSLAYRGHPGMLVAVTLLSVVVQLGNVVVWWLVGMGLGLDISLWYYAVLVPLVSLATLAPSISGLGVREGATVLLLTPLGVPEPQALALSVLAFFATFVCTIGGLFFYLFGHFPRYESAKANAPIEDVPVIPAKAEEEHKLAS